MNQQEEKIRYEVIYRTRRTISIQIDRLGQVRVIAPKRIGVQEIENLVQLKKKWIRKKQREVSEGGIDLSKEKYHEGEKIYYLGELYVLKVGQSNQIEKAEYPERQITVGSLSQLDKWYRREAEQVFGEIMEEQFIKVTDENLFFPQWTIRKMKKRWGSCSYSKQKILLNKDMIKIEREYIEYVVLHEICHLKHPNHSRSFYQMLEKYMPDWKERKKEMNKYFFS